VPAQKIRWHFVERNEGIMKIFLSWSGNQSRNLAVALRDWLPDILQFVEPWMSDTDIGAGQRWSTEIGRALESTNFGVLCVTRQNLVAPWLLFEAGALSKSMDEGTVIPYLLDVQLGEINAGPLGQFQAKKVDAAGTWGLVGAINQHAGEPVEMTRLRRLFDRFWPDLELVISRIDPESTSLPTRSQETILEELVGAVRSFEFRLSEVESGISSAPNYYSYAMMLRESRAAATEIPIATLAEQVGISEVVLQAYLDGHIQLLHGSQPYYAIMRWLLKRQLELITAYNSRHTAQLSEIPIMRSDEAGDRALPPDHS
jgi:hypothetical protein